MLMQGRKWSIMPRQRRTGNRGMLIVRKVVFHREDSHLILVIQYQMVSPKSYTYKTMNTDNEYRLVTAKDAE